MRNRWLLAAAAAASVTGCMSVEKRDVLDPTPDPVRSVGANAPWLNPLPTRADRAGENSYGFNPFPTKPRKTKVGLNPFPVKDAVFGDRPEVEAPAAPAMPPPAPAPKAPAGGGTKSAPAAAQVTHAAPATPAPPPKPVETPFRLHFQAGRKVRQKTMVDLSVKVPAMGEMADTTMAMVLVSTAEVRKILTPDSAEVESVVDEVKLDFQNAMMGELGFDTAKPETVEEFKTNPVVEMQPQLSQLTGLKGRRANSTMRTDGTVEAESGEGAGSMSQGPASASFVTLPNEPVKEGLSWTIDGNAPGAVGVTLASKGTAKVTSWNAATKVAVVDLDTTLSFGDAMDEGGPKLKKGTMKGSVTFDLARGIQSASDVTLDLVIENPGMGEMLQVVRTRQETLP